MNTPVNFEIAKLLKEKGFDNECWNYYTLAYGKKPYITQGIEYQSDTKIKFDWNCNNEDSKRIQAPYPNTFHPSQCSAPTIAEVVMWLYKKHGIWVYVECDCVGKDWFPKFNSASKQVWEDEDKVYKLKSPLGWFNSPTEAYESAITYTLNNLI